MVKRPASPPTPTDRPVTDLTFEEMEIEAPARLVLVAAAAAPVQLAPVLAAVSVTAPAWPGCRAILVGVRYQYAELVNLPPGPKILYPDAPHGGAVLKVFVRQARDTASGLFLQQAIDYRTGDQGAVELGGTITLDTFITDVARLPRLLRVMTALPAIEQRNLGGRPLRARTLTATEQTDLESYDRQKKRYPNMSDMNLARHHLTITPSRLRYLKSLRTALCQEAAQ